MSLECPWPTNCNRRVPYGDRPRSAATAGTAHTSLPPADDLLAGLETGKRGSFSDGKRLRNRPARLKPRSFDSTSNDVDRSGPDAAAVLGRGADPDRRIPTVRGDRSRCRTPHLMLFECFGQLENANATLQFADVEDSVVQADIRQAQLALNQPGINDQFPVLQVIEPQVSASWRATSTDRRRASGPHRRPERPHRSRHPCHRGRRISLSGQRGTSAFSQFLQESPWRTSCEVSCAAHTRLVHFSIAGHCE
ncbi:hypothetical protein SAMN04488239_108141 [Ruegeria marina]|uniref:Uncharacterized protein n=1 Tax=Ruegeria marina TaxID=639004 RepID=A0A1G6VRU8_9RHOB|nr:hypothetical protein SAMN04488239_108141 [Ruegeria marina]